MLAYHVWMDEETEMIQSSGYSTFIQHLSHIVRVMIGLYI